jgi:hypothetical protein
LFLTLILEATRQPSRTPRRDSFYAASAPIHSVRDWYSAFSVGTPDLSIPDPLDWASPLHI